MRVQFTCLITSLIIFACTQIKNNTRTFDGAIDTQFDFALTTDKAFCNLDSIISTDCGGGNFYFTKKGSVFYNFFCMGGDSTSYLIGKYVMADTLITCTFNREYSFYIGEPGYAPDGKPIDPNSGKLRNTKEISLKLWKTNCKVVSYYFLSDRNEIYVLREPQMEGSVDFISAVKKINLFSDM